MPPKRLPRSTDELRGLRAARWIRESTAGQFDRYGPDSQREQQDRSIERFGLADTGLAYTVAQSGRTVWRSEAMADMLGAAGRDFDVLVLGYFDRWQRNTRRFLELVEDRLHPAGAALLMADRRLVSSDPRDWREMRKLASDAEEYSEILGEKVTDGYAAKFRTLADQAGSAPLGFRRSPEPPHVLELDPATIGRVVAIFERYASGRVSMEQLATDTGLEFERIRKILHNPLYNGWARRHRGPDEERRPTAWRGDPPVSDALWLRVAEQLERRVRLAPGWASPVRSVDLLRGLLWCAGCGTRIRSDGTGGTPARTRKLHPGATCETWGPAARHSAETWETPIERQIEGLALDDATIARVVAVLGAPAPAILDTTKARLERAMRELALEHAAGALRDETYLERMRTLRGELEAIAAPAPAAAPIEAAFVVARLRDIAERWRRADADDRAGLVADIYDRVEVTGTGFRAAKLTPAAYELGLHVALPERLEKRPRRDSNPRPAA